MSCEKQEPFPSPCGNSWAKDKSSRAASLVSGFFIQNGGRRRTKIDTRLTWVSRDRVKKDMQQFYRAFSHDVTAAILVSQNNEAAAMLVSQTSPVGVELFSYANAFFCFNKFA